MAREQHRATAGGEYPQVLLGGQRRGGVEALERLVAQQHLRPVEDRGHEGELLPHPVGIVPDRLVRAPGELQALEQLARAVARGAGVEPPDRGQERQVFVGRELLVERRLLGREPEVPFGLDRTFAEGHAGDPHASLIGLLEPRGGAEQRALAGAVRAQQADDLAGAHLETHAVQRDQGSVAAGEAGDLEHQDSSLAAQRGSRRAEWSRAASSSTQPSSGIMRLAATASPRVSPRTRRACSVRG